MTEAKRTVDITSEQDIVIARQEGRQTAKELGFGTADQTRLATAISELTRNVVKYAKKGKVTIFGILLPNEVRIRAIIEDNGPGIPNIEKAMTDGYTTSQGLGGGLPGAKRLVHHFDIESKPGHTKVTIEMMQKSSEKKTL